MGEQDVIRLARDAVDAFNESDWDQSRAQLTANTVYNELGTQRSLKGPDEIIGALQAWKQAMPDVKGSVTNSYASGNTVTLEGHSNWAHGKSSRHHSSIREESDDTGRLDFRVRWGQGQGEPPIFRHGDLAHADWRDATITTDQQAPENIIPLLN